MAQYDNNGDRIEKIPHTKDTLTTLASILLILFIIGISYYFLTGGEPEPEMVIAKNADGEILYDLYLKTGDGIFHQGYSTLETCQKLVEYRKREGVSNSHYRWSKCEIRMIPASEQH